MIVHTTQKMAPKMEKIDYVSQPPKSFYLAEIASNNDFGGWII